MPLYRYQCFGLVCDLPLAHPSMVSTTADPDVVVTYGQVPFALDDPINLGVVFENNARQALLRPCPGLAFLVEDGRKIIVEREPEIDDLTVNLFLTNIALAALLQQRAVLALHGAVLHNGKQAIALIGNSGDGKSTLAAALGQKGFGIWCDEIVCLDADQNGAQVFAAPHEVQLWNDAIKRIWPKDGEAQMPTFLSVREGIPKRKLLCLPEEPMSQIPLSAIYVLVQSNEGKIEFEELDGAKRLMSLVLRNYRTEQFVKHKLKGQQLKTAELVAGQVKVKSFKYSHGWDEFPRTVDALANEMMTDMTGMKG